MQLTEDDVRRLLRMTDLVPLMARTLADLAAGRIVQPLRTVVPITDRQGFFLVMPAYAGLLGAKLVTWYPDNRDVPTHHAVIQLFRPDTGEPLATMDGRLITEMRTGAVSAVATDRLARPDASVLAILGSGAQARSHLEALRLVRSFGHVRVWSPRRAAAFAAQFGVDQAASAEDAVRGADVVVVATLSRTPVLRGAWLSPGTHVNAVGAARPDWRELDDEVLARGRVFVESREAAARESGDVAASRGIVAEIGEVVAGSAAGRASATEITVFKSVGVAVEDVAAASLVYQLAVDENAGA
jgi:thiomorpholine-carboxylate dehydrogenase